MVRWFCIGKETVVACVSIFREELRNYRRPVETEDLGPRFEPGTSRSATFGNQVSLPEEIRYHGRVGPAQNVPTKCMK